MLVDGLLSTFLSVFFHIFFIFFSSQSAPNIPNENIQSTFYALTLVNQRGHEVRLHDVRIDATNPHVLESNVPNRLTNGIYVIKWESISSDGHPVEGTIPFQIGQSSDSGISLLCPLWSITTSTIGG
jgi:CopC domain